MSKYLLDTNICIELLRGNTAIAKKINEKGLSKCRISEITKAELIYGEEYGRLKGMRYIPQQLDIFFDTIKIIPISDSIRLYGAEKARLRHAGTPMEDDFDLLIGCTSVVKKCVMVTNNIRHFKNIQGVVIEDWMEE